MSAPREIGAMLKRLLDGNAELNLNASAGGVVTTTLWAVDAGRSTLAFCADPNDPALPALLDSDEAVVVGYLDHIKVQFDAEGLVLVRGAAASVLTCPWPSRLYRFQRRDSFRVRPLLHSTPAARLRHPEIAEMRLTLRVLDLSIGGCALFLPTTVPAVQPGVLINQVQIDLDADTRLAVDLRLHHITALNSDAHGVRLGCEFVDVGGDMLRALQRYIDHTQKRGKLLSL
ncbi:MAG: flagellar brake protein [Proteobacteria bacterium]|nr:flagellar brake protein [Pseudomonadota bacterium]